MYLLPDMNPWPDRSSPGCDHPTTLVNDADIHQVCRGCTSLVGLVAKQSWNGSQSLLSKAFFILSLSPSHTHTLWNTPAHIRTPKYPDNHLRAHTRTLNTRTFFQSSDDNALTCIPTTSKEVRSHQINLLNNSKELCCFWYLGYLLIWQLLAMWAFCFVEMNVR